MPLFAAGAKRTCSLLARLEQPITRVEEAVDELKSDIKFARHIMSSRYKGLPGNLLDALDGGAKSAIVEPAKAKE